MKRVNFAAVVLRKIREARLSRNGLVRLLTWVRDQLEHHSKDHRHNRVPGRSGHFLVRKNLLDGEVIHKFVFAVAEKQNDLLEVDDCRRGT